MKNYQPLTQDDRTIIYTLCKENYSKTYIANFLGRSTSTITREIKRNSGDKGYRYKQAQMKSEARKSLSSKSKKWNSDLELKVKILLQENYSPEQISKRLYLEKNISISHERIYQFIRNDRKSGGELYLHLRQGKKKRRKSYGSRATKGSRIKNRVPIRERPEYINDRSEFGHWEADLIIGKGHKKAMITLVERKSGFTIIKKVESKNAELVATEMNKAFKPFAHIIKSITFDNGLEFANHKEVAITIKCDTYFADPYSSWQRGTNENTNGLIRQYFPKGSDFDNYTDRDVSNVMYSLNNRPRKRLAFFNPYEILYNTSVALVN